MQMLYDMWQGQEIQSLSDVIQKKEYAIMANFISFQCGKTPAIHWVYWLREIFPFFRHFNHKYFYKMSCIEKHGRWISTMKLNQKMIKKKKEKKFTFWLSHYAQTNITFGPRYPKQQWNRAIEYIYKR